MAIHKAEKFLPFLTIIPISLFFAINVADIGDVFGNPDSDKNRCTVI